MDPFETPPQLDIAAIRGRLSAITEGSWSRHGADVYAPGDQLPLMRGRDGSDVVRAQADADAEFVAHAPSDIAALLAVVERHVGGGTADEAIGR